KPSVPAWRKKTRGSEPFDLSERASPGRARSVSDWRKLSPVADAPGSPGACPFQARADPWAALCRLVESTLPDLLPLLESAMHRREWLKSTTVGAGAVGLPLLAAAGPEALLNAAQLPPLRRLPPLRIFDVKTILTAPAGIRLVVVKVLT